MPTIYNNYILRQKLYCILSTGTGTFTSFQSVHAVDNVVT